MLRRADETSNMFMVYLLLCLCLSGPAVADRQWNAGVGLWGKRSAALEMSKRNAEVNVPFEEYLWQKRAAQWQAANGLWGKRDSFQPGLELVVGRGEYVREHVTHFQLCIHLDGPSSRIPIT